METTSLTQLVETLTAAARDSGRSGRAAHTVHGGSEHSLRQTVLVLLDGHELAEHDSPGEATLQLLSGRVRLTAGEVSSEIAAGEILVIPPLRHSVTALADSALLLTVAVGAH